MSESTKRTARLPNVKLLHVSLLCPSANKTELEESENLVPEIFF